MLGIIGAMDEEVAQIKEKMTDVTVTSVAAVSYTHLLWNYVWFRGIGKRRRRRSQNCWGIFWNVRIIRIGRLLY